jgi:hypothetical protein
MRGKKADRIKIKVGNMWESPILHVLLTREDDVIVARCLDFTVSSHGEDEKKAIQALGESIREYILTAVEDNAIDNIFDPAHGKYWRMYNELEAKQLKRRLKKSLEKMFESGSNANKAELTTEIHYA